MVKLFIELGFTALSYLWAFSKCKQTAAISQKLYLHLQLQKSILVLKTIYIQYFPQATDGHKMTEEMQL